MAELIPVPGQRVPMVDSEGRVTQAWFYWFKQVNDKSVAGLNTDISAVSAVLQDVAVLLAFYGADE